MATVELSKRPLLVLSGAVVLNLILISAQVTTTAGIPFIQVATFGVFSELQRWTMNGFDSVRGLWTGYVALRDVQRRERRRCRRELQTLQVKLQEERAQAQRSDNLRQLLELASAGGVADHGRRDHRGRRQPGIPDDDDRQGRRRTGCSRTWR